MSDNVIEFPGATQGTAVDGLVRVGGQIALLREQVEIVKFASSGLLRHAAAAGVDGEDLIEFTTPVDGWLNDLLQDVINLESGFDELAKRLIRSE